MPQTTFNIAASGDDAHISKFGPLSTYPPQPGNGLIINTTTTYVSLARGFYGDSNYYVDCGFLRWDTSSLPDSAIVTSATLRIYATTKTDTDSLSLCAEYYTWGTLSSADHTNTPGTNAISGSALSSLTLNADNDIPLSNLSNISTTGTTYLRLHITQRAADAAPTAANDLRFAAFDDATLVEPRLIVDYTVPGPMVRSSASGSGTGTTVSPTLPTGWAANDVVGIAVAFQGGSGVTINTPSGWTLDATSGRVDSTTALSQAIFYRVMQSGDTAPTFTLGSSQIYTWESVAAQSGTLGLPLFDKMSGGNNASSTTVSAPTLTPLRDNALLLFFGTTNTPTTFAPPTSYFEDQDVSSGAATGGTVAAKTYYFLDAAAASGGDLMDMQDGGTAPTTATMTTGWTVGTNTAPNYADMDRTIAVARTAADATYGWKTTAPTSPVDSTRGNASRIPATLNGTFASANWTYSWVPRLSSANTVQRVSLRVRLFRGTSATGASATEITAGAAEAGPMTAAASSSSTTAYTVTVNPGALTLTNEYLFFVLACRITTPGGATTSNILLTVNSGFSVVTSTFTPRLDITQELAELNQGAAAATGTVSATAGVGAVNIGQLMSLVPTASFLMPTDIAYRILSRR